MFSRSTLALAVVAVSSLTQVTAIHNVTFTNNCGVALTPKWRSGGDPLQTGSLLDAGATWKTWIPETFHNTQIFGQTGECAEPDGTGCTNFRCTLPETNDNACYISLASGFNVGMGFKYAEVAGCDTTKTCASESCTSSDAMQADSSCDDCRSPCNIHAWGVELTFCP